MIRICNGFLWQSRYLAAVLVTLMSFQMAAGCGLQADSDAAQDNSASTAELVELVKQHSLAHLQQELPDLLGQIISGTGFLFGEESGRGLAKVTASSCLSTSIALCAFDAINPSFEFSNGVCDVDPETRCAQGGPTWADLERRKPDLTQVLEESKSFMTNQVFWAPIFEELRSRGHEEWVERIQPWTTGTTDVGSSLPPLAAGVTFDKSYGGSNPLLKLAVLGLGLGVTLALIGWLMASSAQDVTEQDFIPNVVPTVTGTDRTLNPNAPLPESAQQANRELETYEPALDEGLARVEALSAEHYGAYYDVGTQGLSGEPSEEAVERLENLTEEARGLLARARTIENRSQKLGEQAGNKAYVDEPTEEDLQALSATRLRINEKTYRLGVLAEQIVFRGR